MTFLLLAFVIRMIFYFDFIDIVNRISAARNLRVLQGLIFANNANINFFIRQA